MRGSKGEPSPGVPPFSLLFCVCADTLGGFRYPLLPFDPISLVLAQRNGVEPPKKSAFLPRRLHHPRERSCLGYLYSSSPDFGRGWCGFLARSAFESFARLFKGGGVQGQSPCPRSAERGILFMLSKAQEGVSGGTLAGGSPFYFLCLVRVRRYVGRFSLAPAAFRPHFFGACPKKRCRAAKEKRFFTLAAPPFA